MLAVWTGAWPLSPAGRRSLEQLRSECVWRRRGRSERGGEEKKGERRGGRERGEKEGGRGEGGGRGVGRKRRVGRREEGRGKEKGGEEEVEGFCHCVYWRMTVTTSWKEQ